MPPGAGRGREHQARRPFQSDQHFTEPPPRFSEASLVKTLEEFGIGRPSTYATLISTLQAREYVEMDRKRFKPTDVGRVVAKFLTEHFTQYVDYGFTALHGRRARRRRPWREGLDTGDARILGPVQEARGPLGRERLTQGRDHRSHGRGLPQVHFKPLSIRLGRRGRFHRLRRLSGMRLHLQPGRDRGTSRPAAEDRRPPVPEVQLGPDHPSRPLRQVHRLLQLPGRASTSSLWRSRRTRASNAPSVGGTPSFKRKSRYGKVFYSLRPLSRLQVRGMEPASRATPARLAPGRSSR